MAASAERPVARTRRRSPTRKAPARRMLKRAHGPKEHRKMTKDEGRRTKRAGVGSSFVFRLSSKIPKRLSKKYALKFHTASLRYRASPPRLWIAPRRGSAGAPQRLRGASDNRWTLQF